MVVHLIPFHGIGGVETAAATMRDVDPDDFAFRVETLFASPPPPAAAQPAAMLATLLRLWRSPPEVLIVSLWRSCIVALLLKLLRPRLRLVLFLHSAGDAHAADRHLNRWVSSLAEVVWADSAATLAARCPSRATARGRVISFRIAHLDPVTDGRPCARFVFWGRLHPGKRLDRAIAMIADLRRSGVDARFTIIGPDDGARTSLERLVATLGLAECVTFAGPRDLVGIGELARSASFFLQMSEIEGMAAGVVEAMQLGLVPVVTPAGAIGDYARDGDNAVLIGDGSLARAAVTVLLGDPDRYAGMRARAIATWRDTPIYAESVIEACRAML